MSELKKIMYAEDDEDIRTIVQMVMDAMTPCEIRFAENGRVLLNTVKEFKPDLVLLDIMMPEMDGISTLKALRADPDTADLPAIIMTAKVQNAEIQEYNSYDILGVISKPFEPTQLYPQILELWNKKY